MPKSKRVAYSKWFRREVNDSSHCICALPECWTTTVSTFVCSIWTWEYLKLATVVERIDKCDLGLGSDLQYASEMPYAGMTVSSSMVETLGKKFQWAECLENWDPMRKRESCMPRQNGTLAWKKGYERVEKQKQD
jgi:hypothetical protein